MAYQNIERTDLLKAIRSRPVKEEMEMIMDVAGQDVAWRHDPNIKYGKWDGKKSFGVSPDEPWISIKTSEAGVRRLITRFKNSYIAARPLDINTGAKPHIVLFVGTQKVKFQATGKLTDSSGKSISEATMTEMQELGSAFVFRRAINENVSWNNVEALKADDVTMNGIKDIWKKVGKVNEVDDTWIENFYKQQKALIKKIGKPNFTEFNRNGGFMEFISNLVKKHYGISGKDNWNPADIWLIQDERKWTSMIKEAVESGRKGRSPAKTVQELNAIMRMLFKARQVFGVSLKKVAAGQSDATVTFANHKSEFFQSLDKMHFEYVGADCKMGKKKDKEGAITLSTQDTRLYVKDGGNVYNFQIKGNNSTGMSNLKYEPTASGATAARLGKATVELVERLLKDYNLSFTKDNTAYPQDANAFINDSTDWKGLIKILHKNRVQIDAKTVDEAYDNLLFVFGTKPHVANSKCQQIKWLSEFLSLSDDDRDNFGTDMVFLAKKEGSAYGPFAKIY